MRIDLLVKQMLELGKPQIEIRLGPDTDEQYTEADFGPWAEAIIRSVLADPTLEQVALDYGIETADMNNLSIRMTLVADDYDYRGNVKGRYSLNNVSISIPTMLFADNQPADVKDALFHEIVHYFDDKKGGMEGYVTTPLEWINDPDEQEALKAEIEMLLNDGYSESEVMSIVFQIHQIWHEPGIKELLRDTVRMLIDELKREGLA
jgi:hypothetical protein